MFVAGLSFTAHPAPRHNQAHLSSSPRLVAMDVPCVFEELFPKRYGTRMSARWWDVIVCIEALFVEHTFPPIFIFLWSQ